MMLTLQNKKPTLQLTLSMLLVLSTATLGLPTMAEETKKGGGDIQIKSDKQIFAQNDNIMKAYGNVTIQDDKMNASSPEAYVMLKDDGSANKVIFVKGASLQQQDRELKAERIVINNADGTIYAENNVTSIIHTKNAEGKPTLVSVKSNNQQIDGDTGQLVANGKVKIDYEDLKVQGPKAVFYNKDSQLEKIVMNGRSQVEDNDRKVIGDTVVITTNPKHFDADGNVNTQIKSKNQNTTSSATSTTATTTGTKPNNKTSNSTNKVVTNNNSTNTKKNNTAVKNAENNASPKKSAKAIQAQMLDEEKRLHDLLNSTGN